MGWSDTLECVERRKKMEVQRERDDEVRVEGKGMRTHQNLYL